MQLRAIQVCTLLSIVLSALALPSPKAGIGMYDSSTEAGVNFARASGDEGTGFGLYHGARSSSPLSAEVDTHFRG
ncbi:hypothetical protein BS17DRAFT_216786 [Gyrodon lividus]|nr:hypothetical protein BS17DRAFT_216786 [Gyrodon lividus]